MAKRRRFDTLVVWRLDRLGRNLKHLVGLLDDLQTLGVAFVSLAEGIDATTPAGRLQMHILGAIAEFERARIAERVKAGLQRAKAQETRLGRPKRVVLESRLAPVRGLSVRQAAVRLGVSSATAHRWLTQIKGGRRVDGMVEAPESCRLAEQTGQRETRPSASFALRQTCTK